MSTCTQKMILKGAARGFSKSFIAVAVVMLAIKEIRVAYIIIGCLALLAFGDDKKPLYLGLSDKDIEESRIVKYGLPIAMLLGSIILFGDIYLSH